MSHSNDLLTDGLRVSPNSRLTNSVRVCISDSDIAFYYEKYGINGVIIIASIDGEKHYPYNPDRAEKRYLPASTFKIFNTMIALNEGMIQGENHIIQ